MLASNAPQRRTASTNPAHLAATELNDNTPTNLIQTALKEAREEEASLERHLHRIHDADALHLLKRLRADIASLEVRLHARKRP